MAPVRAGRGSFPPAAGLGARAADLRCLQDRVSAPDAQAPAGGGLTAQLEPGHAVESSLHTEEGLTEEETSLDLHELVEDVADQPRALRVLVVDLQDARARGEVRARPLPRREGEGREPT